jgi:RNA polymerase sigma factor (sigma-70 family)
MEPALVLDESALWARSLEGDGDAFGALFDVHRDRVYRHACRMVEGRHDAEDVTGAAFLELWRRRASVRVVHGSVLPWLLVTASNIARNVSRGSRRHRAFLDRLPRSPHAPAAADVAFTEDLRGADPALRAALGALSADDQALISLVVLEDMSLADAADVLRLTPGAAKTRLHRARQRLRTSLQGRPSALFPAMGDQS